MSGWYYRKPENRNRFISLAWHFTIAGTSRHFVRWFKWKYIYWNIFISVREFKFGCQVRWLIMKKKQTKSMNSNWTQHDVNTQQPNRVCRAKQSKRLTWGYETGARSRCFSLWIVWTLYCSIVWSLSHLQFAKGCREWEKMGINEKTHTKTGIPSLRFKWVSFFDCARFFHVMHSASISLARSLSLSHSSSFFFFFFCI